MKYIIALTVTVVLYSLVYNWLDKSEWFNRQFERKK